MFTRTPRLLLRPAWPEDSDAFHRAIADEAIVRNLANAPWPYAPEDARAFLTREPDPLRPRFLIMKRTRGTPHLVGCCGIESQDDGTTEIGYWIARPYWGLGFATEAASALLHIAKATGLTDLHASHFLDNPASGRVLRKLGFQPVGTPRFRYSAGRGRADLCQLYEHSAEAAMPEDLSVELYPDQCAIAA